MIRKTELVIQETPMKMNNFDAQISKIVTGAGFCAALTYEGEDLLIVNYYCE